MYIHKGSELVRSMVLQVDSVLFNFS